VRTTRTIVGANQLGLYIRNSLKKKHECSDSLSFRPAIVCEALYAVCDVLCVGSTTQSESHSFSMKIDFSSFHFLLCFSPSASFVSFAVAFPPARTRTRHDDDENFSTHNTFRTNSTPCAQRASREF
jgi:hypothetical protein